MSNGTMRGLLTALVVMTFAATAAWAQDAEKEMKDESTEHYNLKKGLALQGYDPVSYFVDDEPRKGDKSITSTHNGVTYRFASQDHKTKFEAAPEKYLPTYGGWCATAMADGEKVKVDPENYKIADGRLFLFYDSFFTNAKRAWDKDEAAMTRKADAYWEKLNEQ